MNQSISNDDNYGTNSNSNRDAATNTNSNSTTNNIPNAHSISSNGNSSNSQDADRIAEINGDITAEDQAVVHAFLTETKLDDPDEMRDGVDEIQEEMENVTQQGQGQNLNPNDHEYDEYEYDEYEYEHDELECEYDHDYEYYHCNDGNNDIDIMEEKRNDEYDNYAVNHTFQLHHNSIMRTANDLLELDEFQENVNQEQFNKDFFVQYYDQLVKDKSSFRHDKHFLFPGFDEGRQRIKTSTWFHCYFRSQSNKYFCNCHLWKCKQMCWHSLLSKIGDDHKQYNVPNIFSTLSEEHRVGSHSTTVTSRAYKFIDRQTGLTGHRASAYLVYTHLGDAQIVYRNGNCIMSCDQHHGKPCLHKKTLMGILGIPVEVYNQLRNDANCAKAKAKPFEIRQPHSYRPIPVPKSHRTSWTSSVEEEKYDAVQFDCRDGYHFKPDGVERCRHCSLSFTNQDNYKINTNHKAFLFGFERAYECKVDTWICNQCYEPHYFDGGYQKVFNYNTSTLFTHSLLNCMSDYIHTCQAPAWNSWIAIRARSYNDNNSPTNFPSRQTMKKIWNSFTQRIQSWGWKFKCEHCGDEPKQVMYDGCVIYILSCRAGTVVNPTKVIDPTYEVKIKIKCNRYITDYQTRKLAQRWLRLRFKKRQRDSANVEPLEPERIANMIFRLQTVENGEYSSCADVIQCVEDRHEEINSSDGKFRTNIKSFLRTLTSDEPVNQFMHPAIHHIFMNELDINENKNEIRKWNPLSFRLLFTDYNDTTDLPMELLLPLLKSMAKVGNDLHEFYKTTRSESETKTKPEATQFSDNPDDWMTKGSYYSLTKKRDRPLYSIDERKIEEEQDGERCSKSFVEFSQYTGGVFLVRCLEHSIALGFHIIPKGEGRNDAFSAVYTHWTEAPTVMSGDWNCQFQPYAMKREPAFFERTLISVDATHCKTHTQCSDAFDGALIKQYGDPSLTANWNDQGVEQRNRVLQAMKNVSKNMSLEQFMIEFRLKLEMDNRRIIRASKKLPNF